MELLMSMIPSPEDRSLKSLDYQAELNALDQTLRSAGLSLRCSQRQSASIRGAWAMPLCSSLTDALASPLDAWLKARRGRTVRFRIEDVEVEIRSVAELSAVLRAAGCYEQAKLSA
ncbi:MAG: hypothetical protein KGK08_11615 [Acidobacteriota bacterium]|nr:hypothetical protein [Acidobacteriota bacterium]